MSARHEHKEVKKILCEECKTTSTMHVVLRKEQGGHRIMVVAHRDTCKSDKIEFCCQRVGSDSYSYYSSKCGRPVKGHYKGGTHHGQAGVPCCGLHLSHETRELKKYAEEESRREIGAYLHDQMSDKIKLIQELTGIVAELHYRQGYGANGYKRYLDSKMVLVNVDDFIAAIDIEPGSESE